MQRIFSLCISWVCVLGACTSAKAQNELLEKKLTIAKQTMSVGEALKLIGQLTPCTFSYAGGVINVDQVIQLSSSNKSVREILYTMLGSSVHCEQRKQFIVLTKAKSNAITSSGYIHNQRGEPLANATIYEPKTYRSAQSDVHGYFEIKLKTDSLPPLVVSKSLHKDTLVGIKPSEAQLQYITLQESDSTWYDKLNNWPDSLKLKAWQFGQLTQKKIAQLASVRNVQDSLHRNWQVSLFPMVGTNGRLSGNVGNDWSFNLLGGLNGEVRYAEVGGVFNINRGNVRFFQIAGALNLVQGEVKAMQTAGIANLNYGRTMGMQMAGIVNIDRKGFNGLSIAGLLNQASDTSHGVQIAGFINQANNLNGVQVSGFLNKANKMKGVQLGVINIADTLEGLAFGFLSFVRSGYQQLAPYYDELGYGGLQLRTGTHYFYNIIDVASRIEPFKNRTHFAYGYGIGISTNNRKPWVWNNDFTAHHFLPGQWTSSHEFIGRWYSGVEKRWGRIWALSLGITANLNAYESQGQHVVFPFPNKDFRWSSSDNNGYNYRAWWGWRVGMRFNLNPKSRR